MSEDNKTHFGYQQVEDGSKAGLVANVFHSVAARYDIMNDLMSVGIHRLWKRFTIEVSAVRRGHRVLDIAGGTGDLAAKFSELVGDEGAHIKDAKAYSLSGGERRRVEISRALATSPAFILLDEPFAGIDPIAVADIQSIIHKLKKRGIGVLITDHNVRETLSITDRAYIISEGRIIASGLPREVAQDERVKKIYLGDRFTF